MSAKTVRKGPCHEAKARALADAAERVLRHFPPTSLNPNVDQALDIHDLRLALKAWRGEAEHEARLREERGRAFDAGARAERRFHCHEFGEELAAGDAFNAARLTAVEGRNDGEGDVSA